jgi:hypothetical protein
VSPICSSQCPLSEVALMTSRRDEVMHVCLGIKRRDTEDACLSESIKEK